MALHEFLQQLMARTHADTVRVQADAGATISTIHLFRAESVLAFVVEPADWDDPQSIIDGIGKLVNSSQGDSR